MQQWDADAAPQALKAFRPSVNSPYRRHFTRGILLCFFFSGSPSLSRGGWRIRRPISLAAFRVSPPL